MKHIRSLAGSLFLVLSVNANAETPVEVKLKAPIEENRGWCLDLRGGQNNGAPIGGLHGHTCYAYNGRGPTPDQAFVKEDIQEKNKFRMVEFNDKCMTLYEPQAGSFISMESCNGRQAQHFIMNEAGQIIPEITPELCLTIGTVVLPGGGGRPLHIMRDVTFEACDSEINERQLWELRAEWNGLEETTADRPYAVNPNARAPGPPRAGGTGPGN
ncbi:MAG: ricin-type beta-trefoil lectin domain protein [Woeseiaceae bacterium]